MVGVKVAAEWSKTHRTLYEIVCISQRGVVSNRQVAEPEILTCVEFIDPTQTVGPRGSAAHFPST